MTTQGAKMLSGLMGGCADVRMCDKGSGKPLDGYCIALCGDGYIFKGWFANGAPQGRGVLMSDGKPLCDGQWEDGVCIEEIAIPQEKLNAPGAMREGELVGNRSSLGMLGYRNEDTYVAGFISEEGGRVYEPPEDGVACVEYTEGEDVYVDHTEGEAGYVVNGRVCKKYTNIPLHGKYKVKYRNGDVYTGMFVGGKQHAPGKHLANTWQTSGKHKYADGNVFVRLKDGNPCF
jgi:hypothetical protein